MKKARLFVFLAITSAGHALDHTLINAIVVSINKIVY